MPDALGNGDTVKLIIQIPCYNESQTLAIALKALPRTLAGVDQIEWLVINDGSTDDTVEVARRCGVDHVISFPANRGLAKGFLAGLDAALSLGADIIVNTDADNQYDADDIPSLIQPILNHTADIVIGARPIQAIPHFTPIKKFLQGLGSWAVRKCSHTEVPDAPSGFRAMSRDAAMQLNVFNEYTYTLETIIQAGRKNLTVTSVPIRVNGELRPSRLVKSIRSYVQRSFGTMARITIVYMPFRFFAVLGSTLMGFSACLAVRYVYFMSIGRGAGHVQSIILAGVLLGMGFQTLLVAILADLIAVNRTLLEDIRYRQRREDTFRATDTSDPNRG